MLIDLFTGKEVIETSPDAHLTVTQTLIKFPELISTEGVDFENQNNDWEKVLRENNVLSPKLIIEQFKTVLSLILEGKSIDPKYCQFMLNQCEGWEESDKSLKAFK